MRRWSWIRTGAGDRRGDAPAPGVDGGPRLPGAEAGGILTRIPSDVRAAVAGNPAGWAIPETSIALRLSTLAALTYGTGAAGDVRGGDRGAPGGARACGTLLRARPRRDRWPPMHGLDADRDPDARPPTARGGADRPRHPEGAAGACADRADAGRAHGTAWTSPRVRNGGRRGPAVVSAGQAVARRTRHMPAAGHRGPRGDEAERSRSDAGRRPCVGPGRHRGRWAVLLGSDMDVGCLRTGDATYPATIVHRRSRRRRGARYCRIGGSAVLPGQ